MKRTGKKHRTSHNKKGSPPRWLILGALAASTALRLTPAAWAQGNPQASSDRDPAGQILPARRLDLSGLLDAAWRERMVPGDEPDGAGQDLDTPALRFEIPPGPLGPALAAFSEVTGLEVKVAEEGVRQLGSPGVSGLYTPHQALERLLDGTDVTFRFTGAQQVTLVLQGLAERLDVTARLAPSSSRFTEPLRNTPQTLTVIPQSLIEQQGASTLRDVLRNVTGISLQAGEGGGGLPGDNLTIRGFASRNDIFVDGVRDFGAYTRDPFNIEQVEVFEGPTSLYNGRGSTGGSLNLATKRPHSDAFRSGTIGVGTDHYSRSTFDLNHPLTEIGLPGAALRLNAMWTENDAPGRDVVENQRWGASPSVAFGLGTPTRVTLNYSYLDQDNIPDYGLPWVPPTNIPLAEHADRPAPVDYDNFYGLRSRDYEKTVTGIATAQIDHDFSNNLSLRSVVRQGEASRDSVITAPRFATTTGTELNRQLQSRDLEDDILAWQTDLTTHFRSGAIDHALVAGVEVARETSKNFARTGPTAPLAGLENPNPDDPYTGPITRTGARTESTADTGAVFVSDTLKLGSKWQLTGGLRWDHFTVDYDSRAVDGIVTPFSRTDEMLTWRTGVVHNPRPNGSLYAAASTSFNPGAEGNTGLSLSTSTVDLEPEKSRGYEIGTKWDFVSGRLGLNAAIFRTDKTNARTPGIDPGDPPIVLEGEQRIDGVELGVSGTLTAPWYLFLGYTYLNSEVLASNTPTEVGKQLANTPEHSVSLWTTYLLRPGFEIGGGAQFVDDRFNNNTETRFAPGYWLFDAMASYEVNQRFTLRLNINNLADERYIDRVGGGHFIPGATRSATLTTQIRF
jgi:catecholate siderophore receptor